MKSFIWKMVTLKKGEVLNTLSIHPLVFQNIFIICKASSGDEASIKEILNFYDAYISKLCLRPFYHENGNVSMQVDEEWKGEIQTAMVKAMLKFEIKIKR